MDKLRWNSDIQYRKIGDIHLLIDVRKASRIIEISSLLGSLFLKAKFLRFDQAFYEWEIEVARDKHGADPKVVCRDTITMLLKRRLIKCEEKI